MTNTPNTKEQFIMLPRSVMESDAYRTLGINGRRILDCLGLEHLRKGGKKNGELKAPHRQLVKAGISAGYVSRSIRDLENRGLILGNRVYRTATTYTVTYLKLPNGRMPEPLWKAYKEPATAERPRPKPRNLPRKVAADDAKSASQSEGVGVNLARKVVADGQKNCLHYERHYLEVLSNQSRDNSIYQEESGREVVVALRAEGSR